MTARPARWTILRDTSPLRGPTDADVLGAVIAADRAEARRIGERLFPGVALVAVASRQWAAPKIPRSAAGVTAPLLPLRPAPDGRGDVGRIDPSPGDLNP